MMDESRVLDYINEIIDGKGKIYLGPSAVFKYRKFDEFTKEMLEDDYVFLCPAKDLDDKEECDTSIDQERLFDLYSNNLKRECVWQIVDLLKPYMSQDDFEMTRFKIARILNHDGTVRANFMLDLSHELQEVAPSIDIAPFVNWIIGIPKKLDTPEMRPQFENLLSLAINAKEAVGVCSFATSSEHGRMWDEYADKRSGYCIEYDVSEYESKNDILPVVYSNTRETNMIINLVANFIGTLIQSFSHDEIRPDKSQFIRLFLTKNADKWSWQDEWRLIGKGGDKPKAPKIKRVIVGENATEDNKNLIKELSEKHDFEVVFR